MSNRKPEGSSATEAASTRSQLRVRCVNGERSCEVYTTIHGTGVFRWIKVTKEIADWYCKHFGLQLEIV